MSSDSPSTPPSLVRVRADGFAFLVALAAALVVKAGWLPVVPW